MTSESYIYTYENGAEEAVMLRVGPMTPEGHALISIRHPQAKKKARYTDAYVDLAWLRRRLEELNPRDSGEHTEAAACPDKDVHWRYDEMWQENEDLHRNLARQAETISEYQQGKRPITLGPEDVEAPTITLHRAERDPNHLRVRVAHPAFGVVGETMHLPNTPDAVADDLRVSFSSTEVLIEHPLIGRHARALDVPVSGEMVERGARQYVEEEHNSWERLPVLTKNNVRESVRGILEAALTEPPRRPDGAEELGELIGTWTASEDLAPAQLPTGSLATLADFLAEHGVRITEEDPR